MVLTPVSLSVKSHGCVFRSISSRSVYFLCDMSLSRDSSKLPRETLSPLYGTTQQARDHTGPFLPLFPRASSWIPSHLSRPSSNPSSSKNSLSIPLPSDLIPPCQPSTPWALSTFVILALTYQGLSSIKVIPCVCLSHGTLSFWRVETWFVFFPAGCGIQPDAMYIVGT